MSIVGVHYIASFVVTAWLLPVKSYVCVYLIPVVNSMSAYCFVELSYC